MKSISTFLLIAMLFLGCRKESNGKVAFYLLGETQPFIADTSIVSYDKSDFHFILTATAAQKVRDNIKKDFALKVDETVIYEGTFWIDYLSSLPNKPVAGSIEPIGSTMRMWLFNSPPIDSRNDSRLINALRGAGKLK